MPTNLASGPRGEQRIFVTEDQPGQIETFEVGADGLLLPKG